jgi:hypothetical protein
VDPIAGLDTEVRGKILCPCRGSNLDRPAVVYKHCTIIKKLQSILTFEELTFVLIVNISISCTSKYRSAYESDVTSWGMFGNQN